MKKTIATLVLAASLGCSSQQDLPQIQHESKKIVKAEDTPEYIRHSPRSKLIDFLFTNKEGITYDLRFVQSTLDNQISANCTYYDPVCGFKSRVHFRESNIFLRHTYILPGEYVVFTDKQTQVTRVIFYEKYSRGKLLFRDVAEGKRGPAIVATHDESMTGRVLLGGKKYSFFVDTGTVIRDAQGAKQIHSYVMPGSIALDQNGDGRINEEQVPIIDKDCKKITAESLNELLK